MENTNVMKRSTEKSVKKSPTEEVTSKKKRNINWALFIAIFALLISTLQFVISTPYFQEYYYKSTFVIQEALPVIDGRKCIINYRIFNPTKHTANNVEVCIQILRDDTLQIYTYDIKPYSRIGGFFKDCYFKIDRLLPGEQILMSVYSNIDSLNCYNKKLELEPNVYLEFPNISLAKFDRGFGKKMKSSK